MDKLLLMGSSAYNLEELPAIVRERIDEAMAQDMTLIIGEARGACRRYQDYLKSMEYKNVIVGHARSIRYNAGGWKTVKYGDDLKERENTMIEDCDHAIIIWVNSSSVIAKNLEQLKNLGKPTFVYEYSTKDGTERYGPIDPTRTYARRYHPKVHSEIDARWINELIDNFLSSGKDEKLVESKNPVLIGYYLNKTILEREIDNFLEIRVESGSCYLRRVRI